MRSNRTIFVDCDGTLVVRRYDKEWEPNYGDPFERRGDDSDEERPNKRLIEAIDTFVHGQMGLHLVVWSGGGRWYAQRWMEKFLAHLTVDGGMEALAKDPSLPQVGDFIVDDEQYRPRCGVQSRPFVEGQLLDGAVVFTPADFADWLRRED